jgi:uncharacterized surface anchored protein
MRRKTLRRTGAFIALGGLLLVLGAAAAGAARADESCGQPGVAPKVGVRDQIACTGTLRIEKRAGSVEGPLLPGATFSVDCTGEGEPPPVVVTGLDGDGVATTGEITVEGLPGMSCDVTEVAAPDGYDLPDEPSQQLVIPSAGTSTTTVFVNVLSPVATETPTETPTEEPTTDPVVEPGDPDPSISPTVLGVKITRVPTLPSTGPRSGVLPASLLGLGFVLLGLVLVLRGKAVARRH